MLATPTGDDEEDDITDAKFCCFSPVAVAAFVWARLSSFSAMELRMGRDWMGEGWGAAGGPPVRVFGPLERATLRPRGAPMPRLLAAGGSGAETVLNTLGSEGGGATTVCSCGPPGEDKVLPPFKSRRWKGCGRGVCEFCVVFSGPSDGVLLPVVEVVVVRGGGTDDVTTQRSTVLPRSTVGAGNRWDAGPMGRSCGREPGTGGKCCP